MKTVLNGVYYGTGATVYLCVGAIPDKVELVNLGNTTNPLILKWRKEFIKYSGSYGGIILDGAGTHTYLTTTGIFPYEGGDMLTTTNQTNTTYGGGIYLGWDLQDYRKNNSFGVASGFINRWTQYSTNTGKWNTPIVATGARIGIGSPIWIKEDLSGKVKKSVVTALTSTGASTNNVTLSRTITDGDIVYIGGMYSLAPISVGKITPAGIQIADTTVNATSKVVAVKISCEIPNARIN